MQAYLALRYPFRNLASSASKPTPAVVEFGVFFAVQGFAFALCYVLTPGPTISLNGTWVVERMQVAGHDTDVQGLITWMIDGETLITQGKAEGTIKTDSAKKPPTIDVIEDGKSAVGIYELNGDVLKICFGTQGGKGKRPTDWSSTADNKQSLVIMKRQRP